MSALDVTLLNLKVIARVPQNGRLTRSVNGVVSLEDEQWYSSIKRFLMCDGRKQTLRDIRYVVDAAIDKATDLVHSRYMGDGLGGHGGHAHQEEHKVLAERLALLCDEMRAALGGLQNLMVTYAADANVTSELDLLMTKLRLTLNRVSGG